MADYSDRALRAFVEGVRAAARSGNESEHAGVLDTTGGDASTGSDETGRSDAMPRPHYHDHRAANDKLHYDHDRSEYLVHLAEYHNRHDGTPNKYHRYDHSSFFDHDATAVYQHHDPKPVRDARAHIERAEYYHKY